MLTNIHVRHTTRTGMASSATVQVREFSSRAVHVHLTTELVDVEDGRNHAPGSRKLPPKRRTLKTMNGARTCPHMNVVECMNHVHHEPLQGAANLEEVLGVFHRDFQA